MMKSTKKVLITGGAGFIGSHLCESYLKQGREVTVLDDFSTGSIENLDSACASYGEQLKIVCDTILNKSLLHDLISSSDLVIHLAAFVGVRYILDNPLSSILVNVGGTESVLELCDQFNKKVLIASTSEVYGKQKNAPLSETDDITFGCSSRLRWSYAGGKLMDEFLALAYNRERKLPTVVVRFFNTVGPRQTGSYGMVIPRLVAQALNNEPMTVFGDGRQTRTFTHVDEVVLAIQKLMESEAAEGEVVNIGGVEEVSILDVARRIKELTGSSSEIQLISYEQAYSGDFEDMQRRVPSTDKLFSLTGFRPTKGLDAILNDVIEFHQGLLELEEDQKAVANL